MAYRIGIDAGSKTIKLVALDVHGEIAYYIYRRHRSNIRRTLVRLIDDFVERFGNLEGSIAITGSAGIAVARMLGLPFVQEVIATTTAVRMRFPHADAIVELGGEDAKVVYLSGTLEQRMNATCAGGTGGFIDTMAGMLAVRPAEMNQLAAKSTHEYPIASRCAVFAQTDVRPLLAAGVSKEDIAASALSAVVRQTLGGLACGRPLRGTIVFLGGPFEYIPELTRRFRTALELNDDTGICPKNAHLFTAMGAAIEGADHAPSMTLSRLSHLVVKRDYPDEELGYLPPLFNDLEERSAFASRHDEERFPREHLFNCSGPLYLGFDAGSTTVKYAVLNDEGALVTSGYRISDGNVLETALVMLTELYNILSPGENTYIAQSVVVGYGDEMLRQALRIDSDIVETTAHLRAAQAMVPDVSFVLDIGGQDMKAMWVKDSQVVDAILNEACSSGCGAFVQSMARSLNMTQQGFSTAAMESKRPFDLGTKCTVFMTSRVRHAQKAGADPSDIAAGVAYSVVHNALYRVIGRDKSADMGQNIVVQGGAFKSDAVLRAFEKVSGARVVRPDTAHLMGAIGAALVARDRAHDLQSREGNENTYVASSIVTPEELSRIVPRYAALQCTGCANACTLSVVSFGDGRRFVSGNRCSAGREIAERHAFEQEFGDADDVGMGLPRMRKHRKRRNRIEASFNPLIHATKDSITRATGLAAAPKAGVGVEAEEGTTRVADKTSPEAHGSPVATKTSSAPQKTDRRAQTTLPTSQPPAGDEAGTPPKKNSARTIRIAYPKHVKPPAQGETAADYMAKTMPVSLTNFYCLNRPGRESGEWTLKSGIESDTDHAGSETGLKRAIRSSDFAKANAASNAPNVVKRTQEFIASYGDVAPARHPGTVIGLPCTLAAYEQTPFWHTLFSALGFGIVMPDEARSRIMRNAAAESVPSESVCEPAKITHARLFDLRAGGADAVLLCRYVRGTRCPVMCNYTDALLDNVEFLMDGSVRAITPLLRSTKPQKFATNADQLNAIFESLKELDPSAPISRLQFDSALSDALAEQERFESQVRSETEKALNWIAADPWRNGIVVAGRPYHTDPALMHGIDDVLHKLRFAVIPALGIAESTRCIQAETSAADWKPAKHLMRLAKFVADDPSLDMVILQSFDCGYDAISLGDVREYLTSAGSTFTALKIDEIVDTAHIRIRLRTMAEAIEARKRADGALRSIPLSPSSAACSEHGAKGPDPDAPSNLTMSLLERGISADDLDTARSNVPADICFTAAAIAARAINITSENPCIEAIRIPEVCQDCITGAIPHLIKRATGKNPAVVWEHAETKQLVAAAAHTASPTIGDTEGTAGPANRTERNGLTNIGVVCNASVTATNDEIPAESEGTVRIGIVGNPLLCFDPYMNEGLADLLAKLDATPLWPDPENLYVDDVRYFEQLDEFARKGADAVLYLQSFSCLKGHVQARGAANAMAARHPEMPVTVLDYDPESSALNRENRIRLAVSAARKKNS